MITIIVRLLTWMWAFSTVMCNLRFRHTLGEVSSKDVAKQGEMHEPRTFVQRNATRKRGYSITSLNDNNNSYVATGNVVVYPSTAPVYQSALNQNIFINGSGFTEGISLTLEPQLQINEDYTMTVVSSSSIKLCLLYGKMWRLSPGSISLTYITVGNNPPRRIDVEVASVLKNPEITLTGGIYHEHQSKQIILYGKGFTLETVNGIVLDITPRSAYTVIIHSSIKLELRLNEGQGWLPSTLAVARDRHGRVKLAAVSIDTGAGPVPLRHNTIGYVTKDIEGLVCDDSCITAFNGICEDSTMPESSNNGAGRSYYYEYGIDDASETNEYYNDDGIYPVSTCEPATDCTDCGGIEQVQGKIHFGSSLPTSRPTYSPADPMEKVTFNDCNPKCMMHYVHCSQICPIVYQSELHQPVTITGTGFVKGMIINFSPSFSNFNTIISSPTSMQLVLNNDSQYPLGVVKATFVKSDEKSRPTFLRIGGVPLFAVIPNPVVTIHHLHYIRESQTTKLVITGTGFSARVMPKVWLSPTTSDAYTIGNVKSTSIELVLERGKAWLPPTQSLQNDSPVGTNVPIHLLHIDTGGGIVTPREPITIAYVVQDDFDVSSMSNDYDTINFIYGGNGTILADCTGDSDHWNTLPFLLGFITATILFLLLLKFVSNVCSQDSRRSLISRITPHLVFARKRHNNSGVYNNESHHDLNNTTKSSQGYSKLRNHSLHGFEDCNEDFIVPDEINTINGAPGVQMVSKSTTANVILGSTTQNSLF